MKKLSLLLALAFALGICVGQTAADPGPTPSPDRVNAIAKHLYCPVCANVPLDACGTAACIQWRQQIADLIEQGYTDQQVYDFFAQQFGPSVLDAPPATGFNWLIYILPPVGVLLGGGLVWRTLSRRPKRRGRTSRGAKPAGSKYIRELEKDLKARQQ